MMRNHTLVRILFTIALAATGAGQAKFELSTVKPNASNDNRILLRNEPGGRFEATGVSLKVLITEAYNVRDFQITGGPSWINTERWDVVAKAEDVKGQLTQDQLWPMMRMLIEDRFQLKIHRENKEMPVYNLTVAKGGPKIAASTAEGPMLGWDAASSLGRKQPSR